MKNREWAVPAVQETSRATGSRYGSIKATWGLGDTVIPPSVDSKVARINFTNNRLLIYTVLTRDVWEDSDILEEWINYTALSEVRFMLDYAIVNGISGVTAAPPGIINSPGTVTIAKQSGQGGGTIQAINIDQCGPRSRLGQLDAVFLANSDTLQAIDQLAVSGQWSESIYIPSGKYGAPYGLIKGRPLIPCEACPVIGTPGDIIAWGPRDTLLTYLRPPTWVGAVSVAVDVPPGPFKTGMIGLAEAALERRMSEHPLFLNDELACIFKLRADVHSLYSSTCTNINGAKIGDAAIIAQKR